MGFRVQKRVGSNRGLGINVSKSGFSPSYRSKRGSIGFKGFSIKTGIPGLTFRSGWKSKGYDGMLLALLFFSFSFCMFMVKLMILVTVNIISFTVWLLQTSLKALQLLFYWIKSRNQGSFNQQE